MRAAPIRHETSARSVPAAPDRTTAHRPYRARHPSDELMRLFRQSGADHAVAGDEVCEALFAPAVGTWGAQRKHQIANFRCRIPDANLGIVGQLKTEISEHAS